MHYDEFVGQVQNRARLASNGEAVSAIRATLETLAERLAGGAANNLAAQLPREIGYYLRQASSGDFSVGERLSLKEFFQRVSQRESVDLPKSIFHAQVVMQVLGEAVSPSEIQKIRAQLPEEYAPLFELGQAEAAAGG